MRKYIKFKILGLAVFMFALAACDTAEQEASPIVEPSDKYPMVTFTPLTNTSISEGDTVVLFTVTINKPIDRALTFRATQTGGTADSDDYTIANATIQPWTTEAQMVLIALEGWQGEPNETADFDVRLLSLADKYLIHPNSTQNSTISITISNNDYPVEVMTHVDGEELAPDDIVSVYFDGPVSYVPGKTITFHDKYYSSVSPDQVINSADDVIFEDGEFIINHDRFWEWTTIIMTVEAGAFVDAEGNGNVETVFEFDIPFYLSSYAGKVQRTYFNWEGTYVTDTVVVSIIDDEQYIVGVPDIGFKNLSPIDTIVEDELVGEVMVRFDLETMVTEVLDSRYDLYLNYYYDPDTLVDGFTGYLIETDTYYWYPSMIESSQFIIRGYTASSGFDDINFTFGAYYDIISELVVGDGSAYTNGTWITTYFETGEKVSKNSMESYDVKVHKQFRSIEKMMKDNRVVYKVELE